MNKSELKMRYDPYLDRYVKTNIYTSEIHGEGFMDVFKSIGSKLFGKTAKKAATTAATTAATKAATKTGEHLGNRAGDKIVQLLSKKQPSIQTEQPPVTRQYITDQPLTDFEIAQRVNRLISGGKAMKM